MRNPIKVCGKCIHARLNIGIVASLDFKAKSTQILQQLTEQRKTVENISIDNELFEILALLNWLSKQKIYCRNQRGWTRLFDAGCYAWQPRESAS